MFDHVAEHLNNIEEMTCDMSCRELIDTPIWPDDVRTTPVANIKKESESPGPKDVCPIALASTLFCAWSSKRYREAMAGAKVQRAIWPPLLKMEAMTKMRKEEELQQQQSTLISTLTVYVGR